MKQPLLFLSFTAALATAACNEGTGEPDAPASSASVRSVSQVARPAPAPREPAGAPVMPSPIRRMAEGRIFEWVYAENPHPVRLRAGPLLLTVRGIEDGHSDPSVTPEVIVKMPGRGSALLMGEAERFTRAHKIWVGRLDRAGTPYVLLMSYSGGTHCCTRIRAAVAPPRGIRTIDFGSFDGVGLARHPIDYDGDGLVDFIGWDDRFLYSFSGYADASTPPQILNIVNGQVVDVSAKPGFRKLFVRHETAARKECLQPTEGHSPNGACAAYVASAARTGRFTRAWAEMQRAFDPKDTLPIHICPKKLAWNEACPDGLPETVYSDYPAGLRAFLRETGYL